MTWVIRDSQGRYLTALTHGKSRRGWSKYLNRAALFDTVEAAKDIILAFGLQATIEEVN